MQDRISEIAKEMSDAVDFSINGIDHSNIYSSKSSSSSKIVICPVDPADLSQCDSCQ